MDSLSKQEHILLLGAFAMAVRKGRFSDSRSTHWLKAQSDVHWADRIPRRQRYYHPFIETVPGIQK